MNDTPKPRKKSSDIDRVPLSKEAIARLDAWLEELSNKHIALKMKRSELADWVILNRPAQLTAEEVQSIGEKFHDQIHFANWIVRQLKAAKADGKSISIDEILRSKTHKQ